MGYLQLLDEYEKGVLQGLTDSKLHVARFEFALWLEQRAAQQKRVPDVCPECAGSGKTGSVGLPHECPFCDGTGKRR